MQAVVKKQPSTEEESLSALSTMLVCPVGAIRTHETDPLIEKTKDVFPAEIDPQHIPGVFHTGFHVPENYGATPYFIKRAGGNMIIGTPRYNER